MFSARSPVRCATLAVIVFALLVGCGSASDEGQEGRTGPDAAQAPVTSAPSNTSSGGSVAPATSATSSAQAHTAVAFQDVRYGCGPTDGAGIGFAAVGYSVYRGRIDLVVVDEVFGTTGEITLGTDLEGYWMDVALTQEAYDAGAGELRFVEQGTDEVLSTEPVILRMPDNVMCG
mgnify:CR=1 FL=1